MAVLGCPLLGIRDPRTPEEGKKLIVFVEIDRCATDAIESVTGCRMGKRTSKFRDYGIMAATFCHPDTAQAYASCQGKNPAKGPRFKPLDI